MIFFSSIFLLSLFIISGIYGFTHNSKGSNCRYNNSLGNNEFCVENIITIYSYFNNYESEYDLAFVILNLINTIVLYTLVCFLRKYHLLTEKILDEKLLSASDFSVIIEKIPKIETEENIKNFFEKYHLSYNVNIIRVNKAYYLGDLIKLEREKNSLLNKKSKIKNDNSLMKQLEFRLINLEKKIEDFQRNYYSNLEENFTGTAILTFNKQYEMVDFLDFWGQKKYQRFLSTFCEWCYGKRLKYKGSPVEVSRAPEPKDILWENLGYSFFEKFKSRFATTVLTFFIIAIGFGILIGISVAQDYLKKNEDFPDDIINLLSIVSSFSIIFINAILTIFIRIFTAYEKHKTYTDFYISFSKKLGIALFLNTGITIFIVNLIINGKKVAEKGSLIYEAHYVLLINAFFTPLLSYFNPSYYYKLFLKWKISHQGPNCKIRQSEANLIFEGPKLDLALKYSNLIKTLLVTAFYAYELPIIILYGIGNLILTYWIEKYLLLRRYSKPQSLDIRLSKSMIGFLFPLFLLTFASGSILFEIIHHDQIATITWIQFGISAFTFFFPMQSLVFDKFLATYEKITNDILFENVKYDFMSDYDRANPVTQENSINEWLKHFLRVKNGLSKDHIDIINKIDGEANVNQSAFFSTLNQYVNKETRMKNEQNLLKSIFLPIFGIEEKNPNQNDKKITEIELLRSNILNFQIQMQNQYQTLYSTYQISSPGVKNIPKALDNIDALNLNFEDLTKSVYKPQSIFNKANSFINFQNKRENVFANQNSNIIHPINSPILPVTTHLNHVKTQDL